MRRALGPSLFVMISALSFAEGVTNVRYVHPDGSGSYVHIQAAIDSSSAGDTVVVMAGTYVGYGNRDIDFWGKAIVVMAQSSFDSTVSDSTIIDCQDLFRAFEFHSNEDSLSVLDGFVIQRGSTWEDYYHDNIGAGILCRNASPTIANNVIRLCSAFEGGGIMSIDSSPRISGNRISGCHCPGYGAGIRCEGGSPVIENNDIFWNDCTYCEGTGLACVGCTSLRIVGNDIHENWGASDYAASNLQSLEGVEPGSAVKPAYIASGGVLVSGCEGVIQGNRIVGNHGEIVAYGATLSILDNEIAGGFTAAAVHCLNSAVVIAGNRISSPGCQYGGSIILDGAGPSRIVDNVVGPGDSDSFEGGAGIAFSGDSSSVIENNVVHGHWGSGIRCDASIRIANNLVYDNQWSREGGGIRCSASPVIEGNTIVANSSSRGAGIFCTQESSPLLRNNIVAYNTRTWHESGGEGIYSALSGTRVECCDVFGNGGGNYAGISDQTGVNGNISSNPIFCDAASGDYTIHEMSPCAPGNHPAGVQCGLIGARGIGCFYIATHVKSYRTRVDPAGIVVAWELAETERDPRFVVLRAEGPRGTFAEIEGADVVGSGTAYSFTDGRCEPGSSYRYRVEVPGGTERSTLFETDVVAVPALPLTLRSNHPNPFNPSTTISYYLPEKTRVTLEIYDASGKRIVTLADGEQDRGEHATVWNGDDGRGAPVASGVYFGRLRAGKQSLSRKMILLR